MKHQIICILLCLSIFPIIGNAKIDRRSDKDDKTQDVSITLQKMLEYYTLAETNRYTDRRAALKYAEQSATEAARAGAFKLAFKSYFLLGSIHQDKKNLLQPRAAIDAFDQAAIYAEHTGNKPGLMATYKKLAEEYAGIKQSQKALDYYKKYTDLEENKIQLRAQKLSETLEETQKDMAAQEEQISSLEVQNYTTNARLDSVSKEKLEADLAIKDKELKYEKIQLELSNERNNRNILIGGVVVIGLVLAFLSYAFIQNKRSKTVLTEKNKLIETERAKSDDLLLNILPKPVATELKERGKTTPQHYENVTVMFTDFQSFTKISETLTPIELVNEIDFCFRAFDRIISRYKIEKIKTIGDAYLCVSGLPMENPRHCDEILGAAIEIRDFVNRLILERKKDGRPSFHMRVGIHSGPLVAGVVGSTKFVYDVWGDTVNTAARMEQNCEAGKINVSASVHQLAGSEFIFTHRGKLEAKNKGALDMYYLDGKKSGKSISELNEKANISTS